MRERGNKGKMEGMIERERNGWEGEMIEKYKRGRGENGKVVNEWKESKDNRSKQEESWKQRECIE